MAQSAGLREIDGVRWAIECGGDFALVDGLSDYYFDAVNLATKPMTTDAENIRLRKRLHTLDRNAGLIMSLLQQQEPILPGISEAYLRVREEVQIIIGQQG